MIVLITQITPIEMATNINSSKYSVLSQSYLFQPITVANAGDINSSAIDFLNALAWSPRQFF